MSECFRRGDFWELGHLLLRTFLGPFSSVLGPYLGTAFPGVRAVTFLTRRLLSTLLASFGQEVPPAWDALETITGLLAGA